VRPDGRGLRAEARVRKWLAGDSGPWPARARSGDAGVTPGAVRADRPASAAVPATQRWLTTNGGLALA